VTRRWRRRGPSIAVLLLALALSGCRAEAGLATEANCPVEESDFFVLMAQSVPSATLLPCISSLPAGWSYGGSNVRSASSTFWLDSDRAGIHAVEVTLTRSCATAGSVDVTNSTTEAGVRAYLHEFFLHPFRANRYFLFPGGCVTYRYRFGPGADPVVALEADEALTFGLRATVVQKVHEDLGLTLCGAGAPPCVGR
jgi:hypothetical protein